jgi:hypothetical protein
LHAVPLAKNFLGFAAAHLSRKNQSLNNQRLLSQRSFKSDSFEAVKHDFPYAAQKVQDIFAARNQNTTGFEFAIKDNNTWGYAPAVRAFYYEQRCIQEVNDTLQRNIEGVHQEDRSPYDYSKDGIKTKQEQILFFYGMVGYHLQRSVNWDKWLELLAINDDNIRFKRNIDLVHEAYTTMYGAQNPEIPEILEVMVRYYRHQHELHKNKGLDVPKELRPLTSLGRAMFLSHLIEQKTKK